MIRLSDILKETNRDEEIQMYIDIISSNPNSPAYKKYKTQLKDKYGVDYDKEYGNHDENLIKNASLDNIKTKKDFLDFNNYQKYAKRIFQLRSIATKQPKHINKEASFSDVEAVANRLGFKVKERAYSGSGNYAQASGNRIDVPDPVDVNTLIHEMGHIYHNIHYGDGIASTITYASSHYQIGYADEVFAENFKHFFIAPKFLKQHLPEVYKDLNSKIKSDWKREVKKLLH